jgi:hypothetical protein
MPEKGFKRRVSCAIGSASLDDHALCCGSTLPKKVICYSPVERQSCPEYIRHRKAPNVAHWKHHPFTLRAEAFKVCGQIKKTRQKRRINTIMVGGQEKRKGTKDMELKRLQATSSERIATVQELKEAKYTIKSL